MSFHDHKTQFHWTPKKPHHPEPESGAFKTPNNQSHEANVQGSSDRKGAKRTHSPDMEGDSSECGSSTKKTKSLNVK